MKRRTPFTLTRRDLLRLSMMAGSATLIGSRIMRASVARAQVCDPENFLELYPTSPLILNPFTDPLPVPKALAPVPYSEVGTWGTPPGPQNQDSTGKPHQYWPTSYGLRPPRIYRIALQVDEHAFTSSTVLPINALGQPAESYDASGATYPAGTVRALPKSCIYGFNGTFPGPMINAEYGYPVSIRFVNDLHVNPKGLDRCDFGSPDYGFLTHLHNGHTAPECDGNPHYTEHVIGQPGYYPDQWCDNVYCMYPPGNDPAEKQSFLWFHDHFMHYTGANVYKGMVGLMPHYDPGVDDGDETNLRGLRLPGVRTNRPDGAFDVEYDIPLALYDCSLDDGVTPHADGTTGCTGVAHQEYWGKTFFRHYPDHGFVGDIFTVNGVAYPVLEVKRRKYRLRFLGASIARVYKLWLMSSSTPPVAAKDMGFTGLELQGQYRLPDGQQCMRMTQIASEGGLLPFPIMRDNVEIWPAKRREFVVDFSKYMDGSPTRKGDVIWLVNSKEMLDGRKPEREVDQDDDPRFQVPMMKIVIGDDAPDNSVMPRLNRPLRAMPRLPGNVNSLPLRTFELSRGGPDAANQWVINGLPFDATTPLARPRRGTAERWLIVNGGGGWTHPMHLHQEEHRVLSRNGQPAPGSDHPDDTGKEDVVALEPGEEVMIYRKFRTFTGPYVAHCHNLAHEDHNMMFGWTIDP
jgi:FtsP/CotA-like multicopper oxidase with cupredoxin domain